MERADVVVLEVDLDEGLPVVVALVQLDAVEHVAGEVERRCDAEPARSRATSRGPSNSRPFQFCSGVRARFRHGLSGEVRRAEQLALQVVGPAVQRADDVAARCRGRCSIIAWRWRQTFDMSSMPSALRTSACASSRSGERVEVAGLGHHQLVADVARARARRSSAPLGVEDAGIEIPGTGSCGVA